MVLVDSNWQIFLSLDHKLQGRTDTPIRETSSVSEQLDPQTREETVTPLGVVKVVLILVVGVGAVLTILAVFGLFAWFSLWQMLLKLAAVGAVLVALIALITWLLHARR
jgi:hypothetical protein